MSLYKANDLLIVCFKRFTTSGKITAAVEIPFRLGSEEVPELQNDSYQIYAMINHEGKAMASGHYKATCLIKEQWVEFDDYKANLITIEQAEEISAQAYVLLYRRLHN